MVGEETTETKSVLCQWSHATIISPVSVIKSVYTLI